MPPPKIRAPNGPCRILFTREAGGSDEFIEKLSNDGIIPTVSV